VTEPKIDYTAVFRALPGAMALLTPQLVYADASEEFLRMKGHSREQVVGRHLSDDLADSSKSQPRPSCATFRRQHDGWRTGERDAMALQRYDMEDPERPGVWDERYWSLINVPIFGSDGRVALLLHRVEEVTGLRKTSTPASRGSPTPWPATRQPTPKPLPTLCRPICSRPAAPPTTPPWSSCAYD
jgi:PAS domain-containing protein